MPIKLPKNFKLITVSIVLLLGLTWFAPFFINSAENYRIYDGKVYYGDELIEGFEVKHYKSLSPRLVKDRVRVFFKGNPLHWADAATFRSLGNNIFIDKNGLYYETLGMYAFHEISSIRGDFDRETLRLIGGYIYTDKNGVYVCDNNPFSLFKVREPLKKINIKELDIVSFHQIESDKGFTNMYWYADTGHIYFGQYGKLDLCPEIDKNTFEIIETRICKDKNHVYFNPKDITREGEFLESNPSYKILEGADGATFRPFDDENSNFNISPKQLKLYEDKTGLWEVKRANGRNRHDIIRRVR